MSGYTSCACRDCFEIAIGEPGEALCHACEEAGCEACDCEDHDCRKREHGCNVKPEAETCIEDPCICGQ